MFVAAVKEKENTSNRKPQ